MTQHQGIFGLDLCLEKLPPSRRCPKADGNPSKTLKQEYRVDTLIGLIAANEEAQRFYRSLDNAVIRDEGIWIDL